MLAKAGVKRCYGIVGDALNPVIDALRRNGNVEFIHGRDEECGVSAVAESYLTGDPVAVCGTAMGAKGIRVEDPADVKEALTMALAHKAARLWWTQWSIPTHSRCRRMFLPHCCGFYAQHGQTGLEREDGRGDQVDRTQCRVSLIGMINLRGDAAELTKAIVLVVAALFPIVNPFGSAAIFIDMTGPISAPLRDLLARKISTFSFLLLIGSMLFGARILTFFGVSLYAVQIGGGSWWPPLAGRCSIRPAAEPRPGPPPKKTSSRMLSTLIHCLSPWDQALFPLQLL